MKLLLLISLLVISTTCGTTYKGYKIYKINPKREADNVFLKTLESNFQYDFLSKINKVGKLVNVMVPPELQTVFEEKLKALQINYNTEVEDVQKTVEDEAKYHQSRKLENGRIVFDQYLRHDQINAYLDQLSANYSSLVTVSKIGKSYENRTMKIIKISTNEKPKPVLFIEAGMHAREWAPPALALYIINQLVESENNRDLLENLDWIVLPVMNPDGYEYTWTTDRAWRKTRSPGMLCDGTDGNRNFGFHWMENGASAFECSNNYGGKSAFSEVETRNLRDVLNATENIAGFISLHSYGQYLFYPYSYDNIVPDNWKELDSLARNATAAIFAVNGTEYTVGSSTQVLYPAAGCSDDWAMGGAGIDIVLTFELPGGGSSGFDLPPERILPVCIETWEGIKVIARYVAEKNKTMI